MKLILASTSPYRKSLLQKLQIPFQCIAPGVDETPLPDESAEKLVARLALAKAQAIGEKISEGIVIASDQVASLNTNILGKPLHYAAAFKQLRDSSGKTLTFHTALCLFDASTKQYKSIVEPFNVEFKNLSDQQIDTYLKIEQPYDCAGSFKSEGLGIVLFSALKGRDPNTLVGLPLIALIELFNEMNIDIFEHMSNSHK
ncbi:MAG: MAF protein [Paraglaciecola sp.]|jgi:MAF protein